MSKKSSKKNKAARREYLRRRSEEEAKNRDSDSGGSPILNLKGKNISWYKPKEGKNIIDIMPYLISTSHHPQGGEKGMPEFKLGVYVHRGVGPGEVTVLCMAKTYKKPCPICEERVKLQKNDDVDEAVIKDLKPTRRSIYVVKDIHRGKDDFQLWDVSHFLFEKEMWDELLDNVEDGERLTPSDLEDGRSIQFRAKEETFGKGKFFKFKSFKFLKREAYDEDILDEIPSLDGMLIVPTYAEVKEIFLGGVEEEEETSSRKKKGKVTNLNDDDELEDELDDDEIEEDDDDDEEVDDDDNVDDDDEEEEEEDDDDVDEEGDDDDDDEDDDEEEEEEIKKKSKKTSEKSKKKGSKHSSKRRKR